MTLVLLNLTIKISLIVLLALAAAAALRRQSAAVRHFVLAVALACAAVTPALRSMVPAWHSDARLQVIDRPLVIFEDTGPSAGDASVAPVRADVTMSPVLRAAGMIWAAGAGVALLLLLVGLAR